MPLKPHASQATSTIARLEKDAAGILKLAERLTHPTRPGAFRLFLALIVFVHHSSSYAIGKCAVYIFFVLSGYWVDRMWTARYARTHNSYLTYLISRAWRLIPSFVLANILVIAAELAIGVPSSTFLLNNPLHFLISSITILGYGSLEYLPVGPAWSLDIEMQFYLIAPAVALALRRAGSLPVLGCLVGISIIASLAFSSVSMLSYVAFFGCGMTASAANWRSSWQVGRLSAFATLAFFALLTFGPLHGTMFDGSHKGPLIVWNPLINVVGAILASPFALYTTGQESDAPDRMMADLSYIIYLLHWIVFVAAGIVGGSLLHRLPYVAAVWIVAPVVAWVVWRFWDLPINRRRAQWVAARMRDNPKAIRSEIAAP